MSSDRTSLPPPLTEWRRSGRFLLIALALHVAVLFFPLNFGSDTPELPPPNIITVTLLEPVATPPKAASQAAHAAPATSHQRQTPHPVLALAPENVTSPATFSVPSPPAEAPASSMPAVAPAYIAARFDAAYLHNPRPTYPSLSRRLGEEGKVLLRVRVSPDGLPTAVDIDQGSSFERLDEAARQVVSHWRFVPARRGDEALEATVIVPIVFRLDN